MTLAADAKGVCISGKELVFRGIAVPEICMVLVLDALHVEQSAMTATGCGNDHVCAELATRLFSCHLDIVGGA